MVAWLSRFMKKTDTSGVHITIEGAQTIRVKLREFLHPKLSQIQHTPRPGDTKRKLSDISLTPMSAEKDSKQSKPDDSVDHYNILVGDFNCTLDKTNRNPSHSRDDIGTKELLFLLSQYDLTDIWRDRYPKDKRYTFQRGNSKSRIDYIFCDKSLLNKVYNVGISHCPFSDPGIWIMNINTIKSEEFKNAFEICCAGKHTNPNDIKKYKKEKLVLRETNTNTSKLRSKSHFDFKHHCLYCGNGATNSKKKDKNVFPVRTDDFESRIQDVCDLRMMIDQPRFEEDLRA
ncbi:unnamed protein product [Mytilus coruscus]|uniref:Endonuclease/exonuclease/phosphatase domain-containing protein n=1 Tax=Mytilus coruscus TaxID=42192 RepID=A0A6J8CT65_MYTCO|nr:unnamed protein product [Mytilus coruscus]